MNSDDNGGGPPIDDGPVTFETDYEERPPSIAVVAALAAIEDSRPAEVDFVLHERVDPDALDALMADDNDADDGESRGDVTAEFSIDKYGVLVRSNGTLTVTTRDNPE